MSCHGYEGIMSVLCTPLQVKCYHIKTPLHIFESLHNFVMVCFKLNKAIISIVMPIYLTTRYYVLNTM